MAYAYTSEQMEIVVLSNLRKGGFSAEIADYSKPAALARDLAKSLANAAGYEKRSALPRVVRH